MDLGSGIKKAPDPGSGSATLEKTEHRRDGEKREENKRDQEILPQHRRKRKTLKECRGQGKRTENRGD